MDTRHLRSFLRITETRSISRAAESLGIAQPSLSQQVLRLEDEVGAKLFRRTARGVTLTEAGRIFEEHARRILDSSTQALEDVRHLRAAASGQVVLAVPPSISKFIGLALIQSAAREAPHVSVRLVDAYSGTIRGWLEAGKIDLGILHDLGPLRHLSSRRLFSEELVLFGPAGRFEAQAGDPAIVPANKLSSLPLMLPGPQHGLRQIVEKQAAELGVGLDIAHDVDALGQLLAMVGAGMGFTILPRSAAVGELAEGKLSCAGIEPGKWQRALSIVRNPSYVVSYASVRLEDLIVKVVNQHIAAGDWDAWPETSRR